MGFWTFLCLVSIFVGLRFLSWYRGKDLPSPAKQLTRLRFAFVLFSAVYVFVFFFNRPSFYVATFDSEINTIHDAQKALANQNEALKKLAEEIRNYNFYTFLLLIVLAVDVIPALYSFSEALIPGERDDDDIDDDKLISIFDDDKNNGK